MSTDLTAAVGENPWLSLPDEPPYVLPGDDAVLRRHPKESSQLQLQLLPGPFIGNGLTAKVLLLGLNPGYATTGDGHERVDANQQLMRDALTFSSRRGFHAIDPETQSLDPVQWWPKHLRLLIEAAGHENVQQRLAAVEWFPYHSKQFEFLGDDILPSQRFTFRVVESATERGATIVLLRSRPVWERSVPALLSYEPLACNSPQNVALTPNNLPPGGFDRLVTSLTS